MQRIGGFGKVFGVAALGILTLSGVALADGSGDQPRTNENTNVVGAEYREKFTVLLCSYLAVEEMRLAQIAAPSEREYPLAVVAGFKEQLGCATVSLGGQHKKRYENNEGR